MATRSPVEAQPQKHNLRTISLFTTTALAIAGSLLVAKQWLQKTYANEPLIPSQPIPTLSAHPTNTSLPPILTETTQPTDIKTPTSTLTLPRTSTPTNTEREAISSNPKPATPSLAPELGDKCRLPTNSTGIAGQEYSVIPYFDIVPSNACLTDVYELKGHPVFSKNAIGGTLIYFDKEGKPHRYQFISGGMKADNTLRDISLCQGSTCSSKSTAEVFAILMQMLGDPEKSKYIQIDFIAVAKDAPWAYNEAINDQSKFYANLLEALETGENFPPADAESFLYAWQIGLNSQSPLIKN